MKKINWNKGFRITSVAREDLMDYFSIKEIASLTDSDMKYIARKMADAYMLSFWIDLENIVGLVLEDKKKGVL